MFGKTVRITSESVTEGHPDKLCDQISDALLDAYLEQDCESHVALETMSSKNMIVVAGEVLSKGQVDIESVVRKVAHEIGFTDEQSGLDVNNCKIITNIHKQSPDITRGIELKEDSIGAGDQGIMYGFACDENNVYMPLTHYLATKLSQRLSKVRKDGTLSWLYPDGKTQVTIEYDKQGVPRAIKSIIVSAHHCESITTEEVREKILRYVIQPVIDHKMLDNNTKIHINPTGSFIYGGPAADTGLTGRKLMVDTYGGIGKHGGGAFSGKDPTKVDRSAAYMARYVAKNVVASNLAKRCEVSIAYAIGLEEPEAVSIETFGTEKIDSIVLEKAVNKAFEYSVQGILKQLDLRKPQYRKTAVYGHFGREDQGFKWEETDQISYLRECAKHFMKTYSY